MRVAFVHYHVKSGGVTRVMENAFQAMGHADRTFEGVVLCGHQPPENCKLPVSVVEGLGYADETVRVDPVLLADRMEVAAQTALGSKPDVWHIHNHSLGKNPSVIDAVVELASRGNRIVLQIHDFAEDGRPANYRLREAGKEAESSYPVSAHIEYVVLNRRDYSILRDAGIPESQLHWLPNPVVVPELDYENMETFEHSLDELVVYPVRAVRRKNIGEMLLHASIPNKRRTYVTTLGTTSRDFVAEYDQWKSFSRELGLNVSFEVTQSLGVDFDSLIDQAHCILTTSVAEGFGLGFVEPWVFGKTLVGRDLPEITDDFRDMGVQLNKLYRSLDVPISEFRFDEFRARLGKMVERYHAQYALPCEEDWVDRWVENAVVNQKIDFGKLDEIAQRELIESALAHPQLQSDIAVTMEAQKEPSNIVDSNSSIIETELSIHKYGDRLKDIYDKILGSDTGASIGFADGDSVLSSFFSVERFLPLRT